MVGPTEKSPTAVAADAAVVGVMNFPGWRFLATDRTNLLILNLFDVGVNHLVVEKFPKVSPTIST